MPLTRLQQRILSVIAKQPDPDRPETLADLVVHHGSRKGAWPSSPEIGSVMLRERR